MFELHFDKVTLGKANRYLIIVSSSEGNVPSSHSEAHLNQSALDQCPSFRPHRAAGNLSDGGQGVRGWKRPQYQGFRGRKDH